MKLLIVPKAKKDENIFSFINRVAMDNMYENSYWIYNEIGIKHYMGVRNILPGKFDISALCYLLNMPEDEVWNLTLHKEFVYESKNQHQLSTIIYNYGLTGDVYKFCPHCLRERGHGCKLWDIRIYTACPIHKCKLVCYCPSCNRDIRQVRKKTFECRCGYDLREVTTTFVDDEELYMSLNIHRKFYGLENDDCNNKNMLERLNLKNMITLIHFFLRIFLRDNSKSGHSKIPYDPYDESLVSMLLKIKNICEDWPNNFYKFLSYYSQANKSKPKYDRGSYVNTFGYLYIDLYEKYNHLEFNYIKKAFEDYLHLYWKKSHLSNNKFIQHDIRKAKYLSVTEVVNLLNIKHTSVRKLINQGLLTAHYSTSFGEKTVMIERESIEKFCKNEEQLIDRNVVCKLLNVSYGTLLDLEKEGLLKKERGPEIDGSYKNKYKYSNVLELLKKLENKTILLCEILEEEDLVDLTCCQKLIVGISISDIIKMVDWNFLSPVKIKSDKKGLEKFIFKVSDVKNSVYDYKIKEKTGVLSIPELSKYINVTKSQIRHYIRHDLLETNSKMKKPFVNTKDAIQFTNTYINLEKLSAEKLIPIRDLFDDLLSKDIYPKLDYHFYKYKLYSKGDIT